MTSRDMGVLALASASKLTFPDLPMVACLGISDAVLAPESPIAPWAEQLQLVFAQAVAMGLLPPDYRPDDKEFAPPPPALAVADPTWLDTIPGESDRARRRRLGRRT